VIVTQKGRRKRIKEENINIRGGGEGVKVQVQKEEKEEEERKEDFIEGILHPPVREDIQEEQYIRKIVGKLSKEKL